MRDLSLLPPLSPKGITAEGYQYLLDRGVPAGRLDDLIPLFDLRYDDQTRRVVFPVREGGVDLGYAARAIDARERRRWVSYPVEGGHKTTVYEPDRVLAGGDTLFVAEGPFDALMLTAAMDAANPSVATAFFGSMGDSRPRLSLTTTQLAYITAAAPLYRMVFLVLDHNVYGRCRRLAQRLRMDAGLANIGSIDIGQENVDPGATRFDELAALVAFASTSSQPEIRWMWERRLVTGAA